LTRLQSPPLFLSVFSCEHFVNTEHSRGCAQGATDGVMQSCVGGLGDREKWRLALCGGRLLGRLINLARATTSPVSSPHVAKPQNEDVVVIYAESYMACERAVAAGGGHTSMNEGRSLFSATAKFGRSRSAAPFSLKETPHALSADIKNITREL
jgi:hypothetical protein